MKIYNYSNLNFQGGYNSSSDSHSNDASDSYEGNGYGYGSRRVRGAGYGKGGYGNGATGYGYDKRDVASWIHGEGFNQVDYNKVDHHGLKPTLNYNAKSWY